MTGRQISKKGINRLGISHKERFDVTARFCNRCDRKLAEAIVDEPFCQKCGCPEFRIRQGRESIEKELAIGRNTGKQYAKKMQKQRAMRKRRRQK